MYSLSGTAIGAPGVPDRRRRPARSRSSRRGQSTPAFDVGHTWQTNAQYERALGRDFTASVGVVYTNGYNLPVVNDINLINPIGTLADGRPIYSTTVSAATRMDPRFNHIIDVQSLGESTFKSVMLDRQALLATASAST